MRNLQIFVIKLVEKVSINLLRHPKSTIGIISIIIDAPAVVYAMVSRNYTPKPFCYYSCLIVSVC